MPSPSRLKPNTTSAMATPGKVESHLSYPVLAYFRSQHGNQSWLAGLTAVLDTCAFVLSAVEEAPRREAGLTFAMARHTVVDLCQVFGADPAPLPDDRLPALDLARMRTMLREAGLLVQDGPEAEQRLGELRRMYEPYTNALSLRLLMPLPTWIPAPGGRDNWQRSPWR